MLMFYILFAKVVNPKTEIIKKIGEKVLVNQKSYNKFFMMILLVPALLIALLSLTNFSIQLRNVIMGGCLGITIYIGTEVGKYREVMYSKKSKKKKR